METYSLSDEKIEKNEESLTERKTDAGHEAFQRRAICHGRSQGSLFCTLWHGREISEIPIIPIPIRKKSMRNLFIYSITN